MSASLTTGFEHSRAKMPVLASQQTPSVRAAFPGPSLTWQWNFSNSTSVFFLLDVFSVPLTTLEASAGDCALTRCYEQGFRFTNVDRFLHPFQLTLSSDQIQTPAGMSIPPSKI